MTAFRLVDPRRLLRHPAWDALAVGLAIAHGVVLVTFPSLLLIAVATWWNANTIAHHFIHLPFFRSPWLNGLYSAYSSLLLGVPQSLWRKRHLSHHFPRKERAVAARSSGRWPGASSQIAFEACLVAACWTAIAVADLRSFASIYLPGWAIGMGLCQLHGHYEHARGTTSHYGWLYNVLFFKDGYHLEHHARPGEHWSRLDRGTRPTGHTSRWPPVLRWLDGLSLNGLERLVLAAPLLQRLVLRAHRRAFVRLQSAIGPVGRGLVVGGGLFPRTPLILRALFPDAHLTVVEADRDHILRARVFTDFDRGIVWNEGSYDPSRHADVDLVVVPLAYVGDRLRLYDEPPAARVLVHDWIWRRRGESVIVAWWLLKRMNLVRGAVHRAETRVPAA